MFCDTLIPCDKAPNREVPNTGRPNGSANKLYSCPPLESKLSTPELCERNQLSPLWFCRNKSSPALLELKTIVERGRACTCVLYYIMGCKTMIGNIIPVFTAVSAQKYYFSTPSAVIVKFNSFNNPVNYF